MGMILKAALTSAALLAIAGTAQGQIVIGGGGEGPPGCGDGGCNPGPDNGAPQPLPPYTERWDGYFRVYPGGEEITGSLYNGQYQTNIATGQGDSPQPVGAGGFTIGAADSSIHLRTVPVGPGIEPTVETSAHATYADLTQVISQYWALYRIHADTLAEADAMAALIAGDPAIAHAVGSYTLSASGSGVAAAFVETGQNLPRAYTLGSTWRCDPNGSIYQNATDGCGTHDYSKVVTLVRGNLFEVGGVTQSDLDFYGAIMIGTSSEVSAVGGIEGSASAFIDPTIRFSSALKGFNFTVSGGNGTQIAASFVPEPASWAMMIGGLGMIGGALRRHRKTAVRFA